MRVVAQGSKRDVPTRLDSDGRAAPEVRPTVLRHGKGIRLQFCPSIAAGNAASNSEARVRKDGLA